MKRPNIVFINTDQQSWDARSCAGNRHVHTPNIDALYARGTSFERAYATNPVCAPARSSWAMGRFTAETGSPFNGAHTHDDIPDIGAVLSAAGYHTFHAGKWHVDGRNVRKSFQSLYYGAAEIGAGGGEYFDPTTVRAAVDFLTAECRTEPFYLQIGLINPHDVCEFEHAHEQNEIPDPVSQGFLSEEDLPPLPPSFFAVPEETIVQETFRRRDGAVHHDLILRRTRTWSELQWRYLAWIYYRFVERADTDIGVLIEALRAGGHMENTVVVFGSDHGEAAGKHRMFQKFTLYEESVRVPLLIVPLTADAQAGVGGSRSDSLVSGVDLFATICNYADAAPPAGTQGRSLRPLVGGVPDAPAREHVFIENNYWERAIVGPRYKLVTEYIPNGGDELVPPSTETHALGRTQLFDLAADPDETQNLAGDTSLRHVVDDYVHLLSTQERALQRRPLRPGMAHDVVKRCAAKLRARWDEESLSSRHRVRT